jgi:hypothetical protein
MCVFIIIHIAFVFCPSCFTHFDCNAVVMNYPSYTLPHIPQKVWCHETSRRHANGVQYRVLMHCGQFVSFVNFCIVKLHVAYAECVHSDSLHCDTV